MFCDDTFPQHADAAQQASPALRITITIGTPRAGEHAYADLVAEGSGGPVEAAEGDHHDPCGFFYTSGPTGRPEAAGLTPGHLAFVTNIHLADLMAGTGPADASLEVARLTQDREDVGSGKG